MTQTIASLITPLLGRTVISTDKTGAESRFTIARLADKIGTLKDGSKGEYVVLTKDGESGVVINLHPNTAKKLVKQLVADGFSLPMALHSVAEPLRRLTAEEEADELCIEQAGLQAELNAEQAFEAGVSADEKAAVLEPIAPTTEVTAEAKAPKAPSKKERTVAMFKAMTAEGKPRKDIIAKMKSELELSAPGANTYYQNCKSGAWA